MRRLSYIIFKLLLIIFLVATGNVIAQEIDFKVTKYDESDGLESRLVHCMVQDKSGFLWFGTVEGLARFDGYRFRMFRKNSDDPHSIQANNVSAITTDKSGLIWAGFQQGGVSAYDPTTGKFKNYALRDRTKKAFPAQRVLSIFADSDNDIWVSIERAGMLLLDRKTGISKHISLIPANIPADDRSRLYDHVGAFHEAEKGKFWLATADGLYHFDKKTTELKRVPFPVPVKNMVRSDLFTSMAADGEMLWMGSWSGGISSYNTRSGKWQNFRYNKSSLSGTTNIIRGIAAKGKDTLFLNTSNDGGFGYFIKSTGQFHFYKNSFYESSQHNVDEYSGLWQDNASNLWVSHEMGLFKVRVEKKKFEFHPVIVSHSDNGSLHVISKIFENDRFLLTGTRFADGLHVKDKHTGIEKALPFAHDLDERVMMVNDIIQDSQGRIWVITRDYIYHLNQDKLLLAKTLQPNLAKKSDNRTNFYLRACEDRHGNVWVTSQRNGVFLFDNHTKGIVHFSPEEKGAGHIPSGIMRAVCIDKNGMIWIGGNNGYLAYFSQTSRKFVTVSSKVMGLAAGNDVNAIICDKKGTIWVGTNAGLLSLEFSKNQPVRTCMLTAEHGMRGDIVFDLCEAPDGKIWCVTSSVLCVLKPENHTITSFGSSDGVEYSYTEQRIMRAPGNQMRFTLARGYYDFDPSFLRTRRAKVPLQITSMKVNDQERYLDKLATQPVRLDVEENKLSFEFAALDLNQPEKQHYAYMLEGLDQNWVNCGSRRYASYTNLPGGDYVFKVRASSIDEDWKEPGVVLPVHVATVFYKNWWFRILALIIGVGIVYSIFQLRIRQEQKIYALESRANSLEKEKAMVMYDSLKQQLNPHFLFNSLTSLSSLIRIDQKKAGEFLSGLSNTYRYILKNRDSELVSLASEIQFTETYIQLQKTRFEEGLIVKVCINPEYTHWKIAPVTLQNLIENAIKHNIISDKKPLTISIFNEEDKLVVQNNLQRKNFVETSNRKGLTNISSLYEYLTERRIEIIENDHYFTVKIPLI
ncbi:sensor histidine kinase [Dyadobacter sp. CY326]|uniref:sensor histidine kinase n=1 Tax=Dyadobacter sp. CY326 TaxID=2907300 RepID=UPI001F1E1811|nr:sensor histidine kinase [Dyadobacter sp. CY326]MCE7066976.1 histidine kinase [Dyadobacter sp. CY326]